MAINQQVIDYVRKSLERGVSMERIMQSLALSGWSEEEISDALNRTLPQKQSFYQEEKRNPLVLWLFISIIGILIIGGILILFLYSEKKIAKPIISAPDNSLSPSLTAMPESRFQDYGNNFQAFAASSNACSLSKVRYVYTTSLSGVLRTTEANYELKGLDADKCLFYLKIESIVLNYSDMLKQQMLDNGITQNGIRQRENIENIEAGKFKGKEGVCKIRPNDLARMLLIWNSDSLQIGTFSEDIRAYANCQGSYFS